MTDDRTFTHPDVLAAIEAGASWADPVMDPAAIDWPARQAAAAIPFEVIDGRPVNPRGPTGIRYGRNELGHWGEQLAADALVFVTDPADCRRILMIERKDGHGWALPGGYRDPGETAVQAASRELAEETGLDIPADAFTATPARYVPDPRASDEAWMVTVLCVADLGTLGDPPHVAAGSDAKRAEWVAAASYSMLVASLYAGYDGQVFPAHVAMLRQALG
jgi:ADP-ribose pyrophosphatase YjhB (NUDIX family)